MRLYQLKIKQLKKQKLIDKIYVSSNSNKAKIANDLGVNFVNRSNYMCSQKAKLQEYNSYMLKSIPGNPHVIWTMVTSPLFDEHTNQLRNILKYKQRFDSLITTIKYNDFLIDHNARPLNVVLEFGIY